jgi:protein phosphatase
MIPLSGSAHPGQHQRGHLPDPAGGRPALLGGPVAGMLVGGDEARRNRQVADGFYRYEDGGSYVAHFGYLNPQGLTFGSATDGSASLAVRCAVRSDTGLERGQNEDAAYAGSRLLAVADGLGGHAAGEVASGAVIDALKSHDADVPATELLRVLESAVQEASATLRGMVEADPSLRGMATTLTGLLWSGSHLGLVHIGDSRAYLLRDAELVQLTHDHTFVQSMIDSGHITAEEAASHPRRSLLLRALGGEDSEPDLQLRDARPGDRYLLCSDGLSAVVPPDAIMQVLASVADPDDGVAALVDLANAAGGPDNITCIIADVVPQP